MAKFVEVALFTLTCHDGGDPDAEHDDAIARFEREGLGLEELNALLFRCARPARAEAVPPTDPTYDEDVQLIQKGRVR